MGASGWRQWVPWQEDVGAALALARERAFAEGSYWQGHGDRRVTAPTSIADVFAQLTALGFEHTGTHSILDIASLGSEPAQGVAAPLDDDQLDALFETLMPSRAQIEAEMKLIEACRRPWEGTYLIAWEGEQPTEILFVGVSGG